MQKAELPKAGMRRTVQTMHDNAVAQIEILTEQVAYFRRMLALLPTSDGGER